MHFNIISIGLMFVMIYAAHLVITAGCDDEEGDEDEE